MLTSYKKSKGHRGKGSGRTFESFDDRWDRDKHWKNMFGDIVSNLVTRITNHCFRKGCSHKASSHDKATRIAYAFHFDHQKNKGQWRKIDCVSQLRKYSVKSMMIEMIKCRNVCAYDHEFGIGTDWYEEMLTKSIHRYDCGNNHRSIKKIVNTRNMKALLVELDSLGAFKSIDDVTRTVSWGTLQVIFWKYARVDFASLVTCTEDAFMEQDAVGIRAASMRRKRMALAAYINLIKKLAVKCPGCDAKFSDLVGVQLSGAHMDHRVKKRMGISDAIASSKSIEWIIEELLRGNCVPTCAFCHGEITAWENGREDKPGFM